MGLSQALRKRIAQKAGKASWRRGKAHFTAARRRALANARKVAKKTAAGGSGAVNPKTLKAGDTVKVRKDSSTENLRESLRGKTVTVEKVRGDQIQTLIGKKKRVVFDAKELQKP